jgi:hypothetical protein
MNDPILKELWNIKDSMAKTCGYDMRTLFERLKATQQAHPDRIVNLQARKSATNQYFPHVAETSTPYLEQ